MFLTTANEKFIEDMAETIAVYAETCVEQYMGKDKIKDMAADSLRAAFDAGYVRKEMEIVEQAYEQWCDKEHVDRATGENWIEA